MICNNKKITACIQPAGQNGHVMLPYSNQVAKTLFLVQIQTDICRQN